MTQPTTPPRETEQAPAPRTEGATAHAARRLPRGSLVLIVVVLMATMFVAWQGLAANESPFEGDTPDALSVQVVSADWQDTFEIRERIAGRVVSRRRSELGFDRGGRLAEVRVDEGDRVPEGTLLAMLDMRELEAALREQLARRDATAASLELAGSTAKRQRNLEARGALSRQSLDEATTAEIRLAAQLAAERAAVERTRIAIELSRLEAPYPAIIVGRHQDEGSVATPGAPLLSIIEDGPRELKLGVPPSVAAALEIGRRYPVERAEMRDRTTSISASLRHVLPEIDRRTRTRTAVFTIEPGDDDPVGLADGALVWVRLSREVVGKGVWLPIGALGEGRRGTWTVYAVEPDAQGLDRVERRVVEIVHAEGDRAFVRGTIAAGDRIVADGLHRLIPDLPVHVVSRVDAFGVEVAR